VDEKAGGAGVPGTVVITDSASNIPQRLRDGLPLSVVPITLILDGVDYGDDVDMSAAEFYARQAADPDAQYSTSCLSAGQALAAYRAVAESADGIVSVHTGSGLSGSFAAACQAADLMASEGSIPIELVDTGTVSMACGFCVLAAARAARSGASVVEAAEAARRTVDRVKMFVVVKTLRGVAQSGRVPSVVGYFLARIPISPVLQIGNGGVKLVRPERTYSRSIAHLIKTLSREIGEDPVDLAVMHAAAPEEAVELGRLLSSRHQCRQVTITEFTPAMGAHTGQGLLGAAFCPAELRTL